MKRKYESQQFEQNDESNKKIKITSKTDLAEILSSNNQSALENYSFDANSILDFIDSYDLSQYSSEMLKTFACYLNKHQEFLGVLHHFFEEAAAYGCSEVVAYILKECAHLVPNYDDLNLYEEIFLAYKELHIKMDHCYPRNTDDLEKKCKQLAACVEHLLKDPRIDINNYAFIMACLVNQPIAVHCLLDNRNIDINCLGLKISKHFEPLDLHNNTQTQSLIGWIERADNEIINILLKRKAFLKQDLLVDIFCCQLMTAIHKNDAHGAIKILKELTVFEVDIFKNTGFLWGLLAYLDGESAMSQHIFSYMLADESFDWFQQFEELNNLEELFTDSSILVMDLVEIFVNHRKYHPFIYKSIEIGCYYNDDSAPFAWICKNMDKLDTDTIYSKVALPLIGKPDFEESSNIKNLRLHAISFKKAKILLASTLEHPENPYAFFTLPKEIVHGVLENFIKLEEEKLQNDLEAFLQPERLKGP